MEADRMAAPQGSCPLPSSARLTGIESRDDAPPPHGNAASLGGEERKQCFAERSLCAAKPHKGVSEPSVDTCCFLPVWNTGCLCGNECCRSCRSKNTRLAQCYQHGSTTERKSKKGNMFQIFDFKKGMGKIEIKLQFSPCLNTNNRSKTKP